MKNTEENLDNDEINATAPSIGNVDAGRRSLLKKVGWAVPVVLVVSLPRKVIAGSFFAGSSGDISADKTTGEGTPADKAHDK